jgi:hypothetical protein
MKHSYHGLSTALLLSSFCYADSTMDVTPRFTIRSQGTNAVRRIIQSTDKANLYDMEKFYGNKSLTAEYTSSFNSKKIAECLFGDILCDKSFTIQGSQVSGRNENALLADYFYLPTDFSSIVTVNPQIRNFLVDLNIYLGLDQWLCGLYFWVQAPVTWTRWDLRWHETVVDAGVNNYAEGCFTVAPLDRSELLNNASAFFAGQAPGLDGIITQTADQDGGATTFVTSMQPLQCGQICSRSSSKTAISEIRSALGWNFLRDEDYHLGVNLQFSIPTGNTVHEGLLFAPQNGNGHHWELGAGITGHWVFWHCDDEESNFGLYLDANITHMFKKHEKRCFDVCGKPLSRYMLVEKLGTPIVAGLTGDVNGTDTPPTAQFQGVFAPLANITTFDVKVSSGVNADVVLWLNYTSGCYSWDFGYNFWGRSCEKICLDECCNTPQFTENTWAFKGDSQVYGYADLASGNLEAGDPVALSATMSNATIFGGDNFGTAGTTNPATGIQNLNIDNHYGAGANGGGTALNVSQTVATQINTSIQPVFITQSNINFARTKGISNKLFSHFGYNGNTREWCNWIPYFGIGFEAEFGSSEHNDCDDDCSASCSNNCTTGCSASCSSDCNNSLQGECLKCNLSQWGVWIKGGLSFN